MEHHAQSVDDALIGGLSYKLKAGVSYVANRRSVSFFAQGGNQYSPNGVKVMKFNLTGDQWLDPSSFRVVFQLNNEGYDAAGSICVQPLSLNRAVFFRRCRIIAGGVVIEDIDNFNRFSIMLHALKSEGEQLGIASEGFGSFDDKYANATADTRKSYRLGSHEQSGIVSAARRVTFQPLIGLFNQETLIPLRYCPIQFELELVNNLADAAFVDTVTAGDKYTANWDISDIQCKWDLLTLDSSLGNEYASHPLSGKSLPINFSTWNQTNQSTGDDKNFSTHINRSLTRLKSVFVTLGQVETARHKEVNDFYHPMSASTQDGYFVEDEHQFRLQTGSKFVPEYPMTSVTESLYQLKNAVGTHFQMYSIWYRIHMYIIGFDFGKISGAGFTGMSTKSGDLLILNFRDCADQNNANVPIRVYCCLYYGCVLNIAGSGCEVMY